MGMTAAARLGGFSEDDAKENVGVAEPDDFCALERSTSQRDTTRRKWKALTLTVRSIENDEDDQLPVGLAENFQAQAGRPVKKKR